MAQIDEFTAYEQGVHNLLRLIGQDHPRYVEALTYQQRLNENILKVRLRGDTDELKVDRTEIIERLNQLSLSEVSIPFVQLCPKYDFSRSKDKSSEKDEKPILRDVKSDYGWGIGGSEAIVEFSLNTSHSIRYKREDGVFYQRIMLYVDGYLEFKRQVINPIERIEHAFTIDGVLCEFICQFIVLGIDVIVRVGGREVLRV